MLRKLVMAVPIVSAFALCAPGSSQSVQSAPVLTDLDAASNSLIQLVRERGGGGPIFRGGGGGGRGWGGGGGGFRGGGHVFRGGGGFSRPSFRGGDRFVGRPAFRGYGGGFAGKPSYRRFGGDGPRWRDPRPRFSGGDFRRPDFRHGGRGKHFAHWKRKHHRRYYPYYYGDYGYYTSSLYSYDDCAYLRDRALATGSLYWWRRYQYCEYGNY